MNANEKYLVEVFKGNFNDIKDKNIFLYGTGINTEILLRNFPDYNIVGLLDGIRKNEYHLGKYIYDINDIMQQNPDVIIIVARPATTKIITKRIKDFCVKNNVVLTDVHNNNLMVSDSFDRDGSNFAINKTSLLNLIDCHDYISFDIFDTLLMRKVLFPQDVFDIVSHKNPNLNFDFKKKRIEAEQKLLIKTNPTIDQIYDELANSNGLPVELVDSLKLQEIEIEKSILVPRKEMVDVFEYAKKSGKKVYIISDMYLTKEILEDVLKLNGITGYIELFVSCEYGFSKSNGLFGEYLNNTKAKNYLHIGDNSEADGLCPERLGVDSFLIKSAYELAYSSSFESILNYVQDYNSRLHIGILLSKIFNDPFIMCNSKGLPKIKDCNSLALFIAPLVTDFSLWLLNKVRKDKCENLLLAARDGMLIKKVFDVINAKDIKYTYFLISRRFSILCGIENDSDIDDVLDIPFASTPTQMLQDRFLVGNVVEYDPDEHGAVRDYVYLYKNDIINNSIEMRKNFNTYLTSLEMDLSKRTAFFDFVSSGTTQLYMNKIFNKEFLGYYFIRIDASNKRKKLKIESMQSRGYAFELKTNLYDKYIFLESIFTSDVPTLKTFDSRGEPVYSEEYRSKAEIETVMQMHDVIVKYFEEFYEFCDVENMAESLEVSDVILGFLNARKIKFDDNILKSFALKDEFIGTFFESNEMLE